MLDISCEKRFTFIYAGCVREEPVWRRPVLLSVLKLQGRSDEEPVPRMGRSVVVPRSVLEAIKMGYWDFEPPEVDCRLFDASDAMPGTREKLETLADRVRSGLPLWHEADRDDVEDPAPLKRKPHRKPR